MGPALVVLVALWFVALYDPHWWVAAHGPLIVLKLPVVLYLALGGLLLFGAMIKAPWLRRWQWCFPVLCFVGVGMLTTPFAMNNGYARDWIQQQLLFWILLVGAVALVDSPRRAERILVLYGLSYLWWGLWGGRTGWVAWDPVLANQDGYGAIMAIGLGFCAFLTLAAPKGLIRRLMLMTTVLCILGVVASFARGAFLASIAVFLMVLARSPRKGPVLMGGLGLALVVIVAAGLLFPGTFWAEIRSVFSEGTAEGTGEDRWALWMAAWQVFLERPIFGVGPRNFGAFAASFFDVGGVGGRYGLNPGQLYDRDLHSLYFQTLSELGIAGILAFLWILRDFWRRNAALRSPAAAARWTALGGRLSLRHVAMGIEVAMIGFLTIAIVYSTAGKPWFYLILAMNLMLHSQVAKSGPALKRAGQGRPMAATATPP